MYCTLVFFFLSVFGRVSTKAFDGKEDISLASDKANDFMTPLSRAKRGLYHECYEESPCRFEEVEEVLGRTERAYEYYYTFTCTKYGRNCRVKCQYRRDCSFGSWGSWAGKGNSECYTQRRSKPYNYPIQTTFRRWSCGGLKTKCPVTPTESRQYCVCKKALCSRGQWTSWSGDIRQGECGEQRRKRPYTVSWTTEQQIGSCNNVPKKCGSPITDIRKRCSCKKAVCSLGNWSKWSGSVSQGKCGSQTRTRSYEKTFVYDERSDCSGVSQNCPAALTENRKHCSCKYVTCELGEWSDWVPKNLESGSCGQKQTRKKIYQTSLAYQDHVGECPPLPQKCPDDVVEKREQCMCAYRDSCTLKEWSKWSEDVTEEGCKIQTRTRAYVFPLKHAQGDSCKDMNTKCIEEPKETRTFCKCKYFKCKLGDWSEWSKLDASTGSCGEQTRTQSYRAEEAFVDQVGDCNGLATVCPADNQEKRSMCKCKTVTCEVGDWGPWTGKIPKDTCSSQERKKAITITNNLQYQENTCDGLTTSCGEPPKETRKMCNCSYREDCTLKEWGAWDGDVPEVGCVAQTRSRSYNKSISYIEHESCSGFDVCPVIRDETRTKCNCNEVVCKWTNWFRAGYDEKTKCYELVRAKNVSAGFKKIEKFGSCNGINTMCSIKEVEKRKDCVSGGGGHEVITNPPPTTEKLTTLAPTTPFKPATFVYLGCFKDSKKRPRALPLLYYNARGNVDWYNMRKTVQTCAEEAKKKSFEYFSVQFFGECWGGPNAGKTFSRDGHSKECWSGVGKRYSNAVYRVEDMPACSKELNFNSHVSSGAVSEGSWCAGDSSEYQWIVVDLGKPKKISGIGTQGGSKDSWVTIYSVEYSEEGESYMPYKVEDSIKMFAGNSDRFTLETHWLKFPITAQYLKFKPQSWKSTHVCMKIRVYGCDV